MKSILRFIVDYTVKVNCLYMTINPLLTTPWKNEEKSRIVIRKMKNLYKISYEKSHKNSNKIIFKN